MSERHDTRHKPGGKRVLWLILAAAILLAAVISTQPIAWARPDQAPDYQTVPTLTPTPRPPEPQPTTPPTGPTNTPAPGQPPTATPVPVPPTSAPPPPQPPQTPVAPPVAPTALSPTQAVTSRTCLAVPTPGFAPVSLATLDFESQSDEFLVVPGQAISLRLVVTNTGSAPARNVLICSPLPAELAKGQPQASQGRARVDRLGLVAELGDLAPGKTAEVAVTLTIPATYPLGGVIENQAWLFSGDQRGTTGLLTWALPPAWLPATGR